MTVQTSIAIKHALSRTQSAFVHDRHRYAAFIGGIGSGKSYAGAVKALVQEFPRPTLGIVVAPTFTMLRDATWRTALEVWRGLILDVIRHEMRMTLQTGAEVLFRSADDPERLRGPNAHWAWMDEGALCHGDTWPIIIGRLRAGGEVGRAWVTTTPRGPNWVYRTFVEQAGDDTAVYRASTRSNPFVPEDFAAGLAARYTNRFARQELGGEFLTDVPGALWQRADLDATRVTAHPDLARVVVAIDPAVTSGEDSDDTGIVVAGAGVDGHAYVLADLTCRLSPDGWARRAVTAYHAHAADRIIAEVNNGGDLVEHILKTVDGRLPYRAIHASRGKRVRAEPIAALYEQGKVHHVGGFADLEDQMCNYVPDTYDGSPDRVDALVWALTDLMLSAPRSVEVL